MDTPSDQFKYPPEKVISLREFIRDFEEVNRRPGAAPFCFLLGAGASYNAGIPTGEQLVNRWLLELFNTEGPTSDSIPVPPDQADTYGSALLPEEEKRVRNWAERNLSNQPNFEKFEWGRRANFYGALFARRYRSNPSLGPVFLRQRIVGKRPTAGYLLLARILARSRHRVVVTTNFDRLVEDAVAQCEGTAALSLGHDKVARYLDRNFDLPIVAKVHGDIFLETYNATDDISELRADWKETLRRVFQVHTPIIIGYGGNDLGLMKFLLKNGDELFGDRSFYWCYREKSGYPRNQLVQELSCLRGFRLVPIVGFDEVLAQLNQSLRFPSLVEDLQSNQTNLRVQIQKAMEQLAGGKECGSEIPSPEQADESPALTTAVPEAEACPTKQETRPATGSLVAMESSSTTPVGWRGWRFKIYREAIPARQTEILAEGLRALPNNIALRSYGNLIASRTTPGDIKFKAQAQAVLEEGKQRLGMEHEETLEALSNLGVIMSQRSELESSEPLLRQALAARERTLGPEHSDTLGSLNNLATLIMVKGDLAGAEPLYRRALEVEQRTLGSEHPYTLATLHNLGNLLYTKGDLVGAELLYRRSLAGREQTLGPEHPDMLSNLSNLANLLSNKGDLAEAEPLFRRALKGRECTLGSDHRDTLTSLTDLARLLRAKGDLAGAEPIQRHALEVSERTLGLEHPITLRNLNRLASILAQKGDLVGAEPLFRSALAASERMLGPEHHITLVSLNNLALLLKSKGDLVGAEPLAKRAMQGFQSTLGPDAFSSRKAQNLLAPYAAEKRKVNKGSDLAIGSCGFEFGRDAGAQTPGRPGAAGPGAAALVRSRGFSRCGLRRSGRSARSVPGSPARLRRRAGCPSRRIRSRRL